MQTCTNVNGKLLEWQSNVQKLQLFVGIYSHFVESQHFVLLKITDKDLGLPYLYKCYSDSIFLKKKGTYILTVNRSLTKLIEYSLFLCIFRFLWGSIDILATIREKIELHKGIWPQSGGARFLGGAFLSRTNAGRGTIVDHFATFEHLFQVIFKFPVVQGPVPIPFEVGRGDHIRSVPHHLGTEQSGVAGPVAVRQPLPLKRYTCTCI